jgi:hypothetical protein
MGFLCDDERRYQRGMASRTELLFVAKNVKGQQVKEKSETDGATPRSKLDTIDAIIRILHRSG